MPKFPSHGPHPPRHHDRHASHDDRLCEALLLLAVGDKFNSIDSLAAVADSLGHDGPSAAVFLREYCFDLPTALAIEKLSLHRREQAYRRRAALVQKASKQRVALIAPLPPHVLETFAQFEGAAVISLDGHEPPPHLRKFLARKLSTNIYDSGPLVRGADVVVFDAFAERDRIWVRRSVTHLLNPLPPQVALGVHFRPHKFAEDEQVSAEVACRIVAI